MGAAYNQCFIGSGGFCNEPRQTLGLFSVQSYFGIFGGILFLRIVQLFSGTYLCGSLAVNRRIALRGYAGTVLVQLKGMTKRLLIIDNFDSFTYNLLHYCETFPGIYCEVMRNDEVDAEYASHFDSLLFSPGPGLPKDAGNMNAIIERHHTSKKILGVCLGMQAIGEFFGARLVNGAFPMHGRISTLTVTDSSSVLFKDLPAQFSIGRYHSWMIDEKVLPEELIPTGYANDGSLQSMRHKTLPIEAVQFHPESVLTQYGKRMIENWLAAY